MVDFLIRSITKEDLDNVARIHRASFNDRALAQLGSGAIRRYYHWLLTGFSEIYPICAETVNGQISGFCFSGVYAGSFSGFLRKNKWYLAINIILKPWLLLNPLIREQVKLALKTIKRLLRYQKRSKGGKNIEQPIKIKKGSSFGILSIAVDPAFQRLGVGVLIMHEVEKWASENDYAQLHLSVHPDNLPAVRFYENLGWEKSVCDEQWDGKMAKRLETR